MEEINKNIFIIILIFIIIIQTIFICNMNPDTNLERSNRIDEYIETYDSICYGGVCVNENTTVGGVREIITSDGFGYKTYKEMITNAGLSCICDGHCIELKGYVE